MRTFSYDSHRRPIADNVTTLGNGVDGAVRKIARSYTARGALEKILSLDSSDNVVNEMKYEYNVNMQLQKLYQSYSGALTTYSSAVQYAYDAANRNRLSSAVYPSGKTVNYSYDAFDNVASINEGTTPLVSYLYDGSGAAMQTTYHQPGVSLNYANSGLDRYGRVINHGWVKNGNALVHIVHGYDYAGNRLYRNDLVQLANSELYSYDDLGQIKMLRRGVLNADKTNVPAVNHSEAWNFDKAGNWVEYNKNGMTETRTHNAANELQGIATHDANGNMTLMPGLKGKYDAWNRLVEVRNADDVVIATYEYNGLNQRIKKTVGGVLTKSFYNENWQEVESVTGSQMTSYVWGLRYIDDLVLREKGAERLYSIADPNWNVVALTDTSGTVVERMKYDAFGKITWLDGSFGVKTASDYGWNRTFTGQVFDSETGLMLYRMRYFNVLLGRWSSRDPIEYEAGDVNLFRYVCNRNNFFIDPLGLAEIKAPGGPYYVHANDSDPFPSDPHAHQGRPRSSTKINLNTGEICKGTKPTGKKISSRTLDAIWEELAKKGKYVRPVVKVVGSTLAIITIPFDVVFADDTLIGPKTMGDAEFRNPQRCSPYPEQPTTNLCPQDSD